MPRKKPVSRVAQEANEALEQIESPVYSQEDRAINATRLLQHYSRQPFLEVLALFLGCKPTAESIQEWANAYPDRWAAALRNLATISGYTEKTETKVDHFLHVGSLSDADLRQKLQESREKQGLIIDQSGNKLN